MLCGSTNVNAGQLQVWLFYLDAVSLTHKELDAGVLESPAHAAAAVHYSFAAAVAPLCWIWSCREAVLPHLRQHCTLGDSLRPQQPKIVGKRPKESAKFQS